MRAGKLNKRVTLMRRGPAVDDGFENVPGDWAPLGKRWASVKPVMRREQQEADGQVSRREKSVWMRNDSLTGALTATDAVTIGGVLHEMVADPIEVEDGDGIELIVVAAN